MGYELAEKTPKELREIAKKLELNLPPALGKEKIVDVITTAMIEKQMRIENQVRDKLRKEAESHPDYGLKAGLVPKPAPETLAIEKSPKVIVKFINMENPATESGEPGADWQFDCGAYHFHLYDRKEHVLPAILVSTDKKDFWISRLQRCVLPVFANKQDKQGRQVSVQVGSIPRFEFITLGPAPDDAKFGLIAEKAEVKV